MKHWTIQKQIGVAFTVVVTLVIGLGIFSINRLGHIKKSSDSIVNDSFPGVIILGKLKESIRENYSLVEKHILSTNDAAIAKIEAAILANRETNNVLLKNYEATIVQPQDRELFEADKPVLASYQASLDSVLVLSRSNLNDAATSMLVTKVDPEFNHLIDTIEAHLQYNTQNGLDESARITGLIHTSRSAAVAVASGAVVIASLLGYFITRKIKATLTELADGLAEGSSQVASAASQMSNTSQILAEAATEQAASLEETSASLEEISSMTKRNAENATNSKQLSEQASESAATGLERLAELGHTLDSIKSAVSDMEAAVHEMQGSSQEIAKIIKTIDEIAFQTNLLALNAAVEAARAGEAGMGFAVVADEVRALAQRSAQAARDTSDKIEHAIKRSELGGVASAKVVKNLADVEVNAQKIEHVFTGIVTQIKSLNSVIAEIAAASQEQNSGVAEVNMAVSQMDKVTQSNASNAEENASAAEELHSQAETMQSIVTQLKLVVDSSATTTSSTPIPQRSAPSAQRTNRAAGGSGKKAAASARPAYAEDSHKKSQEIPMPEPATARGSNSGFKDF
jgi:methyl-accepting chemotaxis protein